MTGCITMFGGTGFIGRHLVGALVQSGAAIRLAVRRPGLVKMAAEPLKAVQVVQADVLDDTAVGSAITGADAVLNLVGILTETAPQTYRAIHVEGARRVVLAAQRHGATRLIHISALGASLTSPAISDRTKAEGEQAVREVFPQATIVRPSLDSSPENRREEESNNLEALGGKQINDLLNGFVGAVVGGFEFARWLVSGIGAVMEAAVGEGSAEPFVEEEEEQRDLDSFWREAVGVAGAVAL
jgi:nucleoside-diphosphate-sugar epimerase